MRAGRVNSGRGALPRPRYSCAKRAAIVAACASVLTGTALALPAATFADSTLDTPPIATVDLGGATVDVPDLGIPLPNVEVGTDQLPLARVTKALDVAAQVDTAPETTDTAPTTTEPSTTEPSTTDPSTTDPSTTDPSTTAPSTTAPARDVPSAPARTEPSRTEPISDAPISDLPSDNIRTSSGRSAPAQAVAARAPGSRPTTASPLANRAVAIGVLEAKTQRQIERAAVIRAAQVLGTEKSAPATGLSKDGLSKDGLSKDGLGLVAPLTDLGSRGGGDTLNFALRSGPDSASGDWNLLPEALYAAIPVLLAAAAAAVHGRRYARLTAVGVGVVPRRRHAGAK
ncbi:MAG TPA: hypothetical protein VMZ00_00400 [Sporichthya sp.]|nr:hypothetical protein [Sporichthya sp.]